MNTRADIVAAISKASSLQEQITLVEALDDFDRKQAQAHRDARSIDLADAVITPTMTPVHAFVPHTAATDWLGSDEDRAEYHQPIMAEAALWYGRVSPEVKADVAEFGEQAQGMARRTAGVYGADASAAEADFLSYVGFLYRREAASGLDQIDQTVAPDGVTNKPTPVPPDVFDTFEEPVHPINQGVSGTETSERNPLLQEIVQGGGGQSQGEVQDFHQGSVALGYLYNMEDFLKAQAASGLDQIEQTTAPDGVTERPTPLPGDVAFPWLLGGPEVDPEAVPGGTPNQAAPAAGQKEAFLPLLAPLVRAVAPTVIGEVAGSVLGGGDDEEKKGSALSTASTLKEGGSNFANDLANGVDGLVPDRRAQIGMHLQHNHFPPIPREMVDPSIAAIDAVNDGDHHREIDLPDGVSFRGSDTAPAHEIVSAHHLHPWLEDDDSHYASKKTAANTIFHESYGEVTRPQLAAYRKHNISPVDHDELVDHYGDDSAAITKAVKDPANHLEGSNSFSMWKHNDNQRGGRWASKKTADMFGASDAPHAVPQPGVANSPATTPQPQQGGSYTAGFAAGMADAKTGQAATYADNSAGLPFSAGYVEGYGKGMGEVSSAQPQSVPGSMGGDNGLSHMTGSKTAGEKNYWGSDKDDVGEGYCKECEREGGRHYESCPLKGTTASKTAALTKVSDLFVTSETRKRADFAKAYKFASKWNASKPLVKKGSAEFEAGLYAGISDNAPAQSAWVQAHAVQAAKHPDFSERISLHASFSGKVVASQGGVVEGPYIRTESATSTDLDISNPSGTASPVGETPINGPGRPGPLAGQADAAAPGGPAPYNGTEPFGSPVVPTGVPTEPTGTSQLQAPIDDSGNLQSADRTLAFRKRVQAGLAAISN